MNKKLVIKILIIDLVIILLSSNVTNSLFAKENQIKNNFLEDEQPEFYNVIIWRINKGIVEQEIKTISYEVAMQIKAKYNQIEKTNNYILEKFEQKNSILREYGILKIDETLEKITHSKFNIMKKNNNLKNKLLFEQCASTFGVLIASVHGPVSGLNLGLPTPFTITMAHIANAQGPAYGFGTVLIFPISIMKIDDYRPLKIVLLFAMGIITYLPFITNSNNYGEFDIIVLPIYGLIN